ncbi:MAG: hypothetical protein WC495_00015 [Patescibacteria group bacterium]
MSKSKVTHIYEEPAKKVATKDHGGSENGFIIELYKDSNKTTHYLTAANPGAFKGYHLHRIRGAQYCVVKGKMRIILYVRKGEKWIREEHFLDGEKPSRLYIPPDIATGLENIGDEEAWLINFPDPAYDPSLKDEQVEYSIEELEKGIVK